MIIGFAGTPGSGKTYEAVKKILDNLKTGRIVYTNIDGILDPECKEMIKTVCGLSDFALQRQLKPLAADELQDFWMHIEPACLVVLDEVQNVFSSRDWSSDKNKFFGSWASTHRHHGFDVVLITQKMERIDSAVRALLEWTYVFRKVNFFGGAVQKKYLCYSYGGEDTSGSPLAKSTRTYDARVFACYKSYVSKDVKELNIMKHVNVLKHPVFFAIPVVLLLTLYMVFSKSSIGTGDFFGSRKAMTQYEESKKKENKKKAVAPAAQPFSEHTPHIAQLINKDGQIVFTNRTQTVQNHDQSK
ncbi:zonular occludens toxin domain-containing protein [Desulfogranum marinum]|uniref:zonular occludens toxin domain-containing protein n=1 Tax=Desulfogranum marinum TaxID=453220 RepID=UPI0029C9450C|nr:zonular occludens toxin domain-containing protein [Desulfogranum marinum]